MFDSLDEKMRQDHRAESSQSERMMVYGATVLIGVLVFAALVYGVRVIG